MSKIIKHFCGILLTLLIVTSLVPVGALAAGKPVIIDQPKTVITTMDGTATFTVKAEGAASYQWQYRANKNNAWANAKGVGNQTASMTFSPATLKRAGYQYRCAVKNSAGTTYSEIVNLYIKPSIVVSPQDVVTTASGTAIFSVEAEGRFLLYQWQYRKPNSDVWYNNDCKEPTFIIENPGGWRNQYEYRCVVKNGVGKSVSDTATLYTKPTIISHPKDLSVKANESAFFSVEAIGAKTYLWQYLKPDSTVWYNNGCTDATFTIDKVGSWRDGYQYRCIVGNGKGTTVTSEVATLVLPFKFAEQLERSTYAVVGEPLEVSVRVKGGWAPYTYTWYHSNQQGQSQIVKTETIYDRTGTYIMDVTKDDIGSLIWCVVEDSKSNLLAPNGYDDDPFVKMTILEYAPLGISKQPEDVVISNDPDERANYNPYILLNGRSFDNLLFQWQHAPGNIEETALTESDYVNFTGRYTDDEGFISWIDTQQINLKQSQQLINFVGNSGKWIRCVVTDLDSGTVVYSDPARLDIAS